MKKLIAAVLICVLALSTVGCDNDKASGKNTTDLKWHQCPEAVNNYLSYVKEHHYSSDDRSYTYINNDGFATESNRSNTKPVGITVDDKKFYDLEPNKPTKFSTSESEGTLTALDPLRWYNTSYREKNTNGFSGEFYDVGDNCRDLGGWACDGGTVKYGMLVRSGELNPDDKELMADQIGIKTEVNLLPVSKQVSQSSVWGIDWVGNPTDVDFMYNISDPVKEQWKLYLNAIFDSVANSKPVVFHCGAGADKTGTMAVMLMGILGCSEQDIDTDYELTNFIHYTTWRNRTYPEYINYINAIKKTPLVEGLSDSFANRCISFALSLGIPIEKINAFRGACIDRYEDDSETDIDTEQATESVKEELFDPADSTDTARIPGDGIPAAYAEGQLVTNFIKVSSGDVIFYSSDDVKDKNDYTGMIAFYDASDKLLFRMTHTMTGSRGWTWSSDLKSGYVKIPSSYTDSDGKNIDLSKAAKIRICIPYKDMNSITVNRLDAPPALG